MDFLDEYPTWQAFKTKCPQHKVLESDQFKSHLFDDNKVAGSFEKMLKEAGVPVWFVELNKMKYSEQGFRYGLATLLGVGKGTNNIVLPVDDFICKFSGKYANLMQKLLFVNRIRYSVMMAKSALQAVNQEFLKLQTGRETLPIFDVALADHFKIGGSKIRPMTAEAITEYRKTCLPIIQRDFETITLHLSTRFRLAAGHDQNDNPLGYVVPKARCTMPSPYKTVEGKADDYGSMHIDYDLFGPNFQSIEIAASTIVHEASHKWCRTKDFGYIQFSRYNALSPDEAVLNADSYGNFAIAVYLQKNRNELQMINGFVPKL